MLSYSASASDLELLLRVAPKVTDGLYLSEWSDLLRVARMCCIWLKRHEGHKTHLTNDHAVSEDDLPDYRAEAVDGKISAATFGEESNARVDDYVTNHCPHCGSYIGEHPERESITGVVKKQE